ncbi:MAG: hypothetical protein HQL56_01160 [Magnetococcales bacterium]|nr:hypothetical protein [Magnetococcales bacterium]
MPFNPADDDDGIYQDGKEATYTVTDSGQEISVMVFDHQEAEVEPDGFKSSVVELKTYLAVARSYVNSPKPGDVVRIIGGARYVVQEIKAQTAFDSILWVV